MASISLQLQTEAAIPAHLPGSWQLTAVPGFMAAETPADPQPRQQYSLDLQHPYNGLAFNFDP